MKKLFSLTAVILCLSFLTIPFSAAPSAASLIEKASKTLGNVDSIDYKTTDKIIRTDGGKKYEYSDTYKIKVVYTGRNSADIAINYSSSDGSKYDVYFKDGYQYQNIYGMKSRQKSNVTTIDLTREFLLFLPSDMLRSAKVTKTESGYKVVVTIPSGDVTEVLKDNWSDSLKDDGYKNVGVAFSEYRLTYAFDSNGNLKSITRAYAATVSSDKGTFSDQVVQTSKINSTNKLTSVGFPSDLASYTKY